VNVSDDLDAAFAAVTRTLTDGMMFSNDRRIAGLALEHRIPAIGSVQIGLFLPYAPDQIDMWVRAAGVVDKILRGASPADIPVEPPTKFHFGINLKTAKALGMTVALSLLARADEVIE
jgi:putative tryptophan/tyrosine transport system substrate-binding protein